MLSKNASIPTLSITQMDFHDFSAALGQSFRQYGFAIVSDHGIDPQLLSQAWDETASFFALPADRKRQYHIEGGAGQRGYTPFGLEIAKDAKAHDLKEFWHIGRESASGNSLPATMPANIWPDDDRPDFRTCFTRLYAEFDRLGATLLRAIAVDLGLSPEWFEGPTDMGNSILRLLHYPPLTPESVREEGAVRAGAHEDINLITLLLGAEEAGLQLLDAEGGWVDIRPPEGALVVNIGDMLQRLTNHMLPSTTHRVVNPSPERQLLSRYSMPFFLHLRPDFLIQPLDSCIDEKNPCRYPQITADAYLQQRLREIGLKVDDAKS